MNISTSVQSPPPKSGTQIQIASAAPSLIFNLLTNLHRFKWNCFPDNLFETILAGNIFTMQSGLCFKSPKPFFGKNKRKIRFVPLDIY